MKKVLVVFVEVTEYNLARVANVYETFDDIEFSYVYCNLSISGHETSRKLPENAVVLTGTTKQKKKQLISIAKKESFDFIIINGYSEMDRLGLIMYCRKKGIPYAIETDTPLNIPSSPIKRVLKSLLLRKIFSGNAYGFAGGTRQKELFRYYGMDENRIKLMPMTVDVEMFKSISHDLPCKEVLKAEKGFGEKKVALYVGRFAPEKNLFALLEGAKRLRERHNDFKLVLIGKGAQREEIVAYCNRYGLSENVKVYDYMQARELISFYKAADVFVLPSSYEPWGLVVNESLTCGTPVIASSNVGCVDDLILPDFNGDLFEYSNVDELTTFLEKWLYQKNGITGESVIDSWNHNRYKTLFSECLVEVFAIATH